MKPVRTFISIPSLPEELEALRHIAYDLHWAWNHDAIELFRRLDDRLWEESGHNPVLMLGTIDQEKIETMAKDEGFLVHLARVSQDFRDYCQANSTWFSRSHGGSDRPLVAYFSAEFGVTECLSIFAGGLGVLAGDHLKSASDLGLPLVGVGLLYQQGYFRQYLNEAGWQQEAYVDNDFLNLPVLQQKSADGERLIVKVPHPDRDVCAQVWVARVGRVPLYLLDTNIEENLPKDRDITDQLYGGDREMRIRQEIVLGIGGYRALEAMDISPDVFHLNEGHSSFLIFERIRSIQEKHGLSFAEAREAASAGIVFTTHTPVAAGHDYFSPELVDRYLGAYAQSLGIPQVDLLALGRKDRKDMKEPFCMTILALRCAAHSNGVSKLHGQISRRMWQDLWPGVAEEEIPITHVTNGVHLQSWISREMKELYDRYLGPRWREDRPDPAVWNRAEDIAGEELWRTHERRRQRLVAFTRRHLRDCLRKRGASQAAIELAGEVLDTEALTIGFARRFATYKRATLLLHDKERLARLLNDSDRPVQVIYAGKAHPKDDPGKALIQEIVSLAREEDLRRRIVFLEDYDMAIARYLLQGVDLWLSTPLRPREASGTSGMKAAANGVLNISILDGWWDEAYRSDIGWAIGRKETYGDQTYQDQVEAEALYGLLEREVVPMFYDRGADGIPRAWIDRMKTSIKYLCHFFNTHRMAWEYAESSYLPAASCYQALAADDFTQAREFAAWKNRVETNWPKIRIDVDEMESLSRIEVGHPFTVQARVKLGLLDPEDVSVELYLGRIDPKGEVIGASVLPMEVVGRERNCTLYRAQNVTCERSGLHGFTVRAVPHHPYLSNKFLPGLITWAATCEAA